MMLRLVVLGTWLVVLVSSHPHVIFPPHDDKPIPCTASTPYESCGAERYCAPIDNTTFCLHKTFAPVQPRDVLALLIACSCCFVAAMAGIGGGGLVLPLVILVLNFSPKEASVISNLAVLGNSIGQGLVNFRSRTKQQQEKGTNIVLGTVLMVFPGLIAGGAGAIALEGVVPSTVILILALMTLVLAAVKTFRKACKLSKEEKVGCIENIMGSSGSIARSQSYGSCSSIEGIDEQVMDQSTSLEHVLLRQESNHNHEHNTTRVCRFCKNHMIEILIVSCWALSVLTFLILRGSLWFKVPKWSPEFFVLVFSPAAMAVFFTWRGKVELRNQKATSEVGNDNSLRTSLLRHDGNDGMEHGTPRDGMLSLEAQNDDYSGDITANEAQPQFDNLVWWLPFASAIIGLLAALLGIGGGELLGPTLLLLNMDPRYSSTTTAVLSMLNSGTNAIHHYLAGMVVTPAYGVALWCAGLFGGGPGRTLAIHIAASGGGRSSIIGFSLFFVLLIGAGLVLYELLVTPSSWESEGWC